MNARNRYVVNCIAVSTLAVILVALLGFWLRWTCVSVLGDMMQGYGGRIRVSPLGVFSPEIEDDPNVVAHSEAVLRFRGRGISPWGMGLGLMDYFYGLVPESGRSDVLIWEPEVDGLRMYYDRQQGLVVCSITEQSKGRARRRIWLYAGPEGIAETPLETLGRFRSPVISPYRSILYDAEHSRFFVLDFTRRTVKKGPEIDPAKGHDPIQLFVIAKRQPLFSWQIEPPRHETGENEGRQIREGRLRDGRAVTPVTGLTRAPYENPYVFVLDASGRIDLLDEETLTFAGRAGSLPKGPRRYGSARVRPTPETLFAYDVQPLLVSSNDERSRWEYSGCVAGAYNHDATCMSVATFDKNGSQTKGANWTIEPGSVPGGPMVTTIRFLLENLHPPALLLLSHFVAPYSEAGAGYRSIFVLPDSFVAQRGRSGGQAYAGRFIMVLFLMAPALLLVVCLMVRVGRDAQVVGLSKNTRTVWIIATGLFGLAAYIAYRLTRPEVVLVTCANCGLPRRPDMERCHRCNGSWRVPELDPPTWCVLDGGPLQPTTASPMAEENPAE